MSTPAQAASTYKVKLYWRCLNCLSTHEWPENRARKYCNRKCRDAAYYERKVTEQNG